MSAIYLAQISGPDTRFRRDVALKLMRPDAGIRDASLLLRDEAVNLSFLNHPNLVAVNQIGTLGGRFFIEMEYIRGVSLRVLRDHFAALKEPAPLDLIAALLVQACEGLHSAHEQRDREGRPLGLIHRDISPHNIMLTEQGVVKVIDFGVARSINREWETRPGRMVGKPAYMAPEQIAEARAQRIDMIDRRADLWALGVVFYEMSTGQPLFQGPGLVRVLEQVIGAAIPPLSSVRRDAPPELDAILSAVVNRNLARRPPTALALAGALRRIVEMGGNRFAARDQIIDFLIDNDISLTPGEPAPLSGMDIAWIEMMANADRNDTRPTIRMTAQVDLWARVIEDGVGQGRFRLDEELSHGRERIGALERRWFDGEDLHLGGAARVLIISAATGDTLDPRLVDELVDEVAHIRRVYPARGQLLDSGATGWPGVYFLAFSRPESTLAALNDRHLDVGTRLALSRAIVAAAIECIEADPSFVHGTLMPQDIGLMQTGDVRFEPGRETFEASLLGVSLNRLSVPAALTDGVRVVGPPAGLRAPEFDRSDGEVGPAADVYALGALIYRLLGGDPIDATQRMARGRPPRRLECATRLDPLLEGGLIAAMRRAPEERLSLEELAQRLEAPPLPRRPSARPHRLSLTDRGPKATRSSAPPAGRAATSGGSPTPGVGAQLGRTVEFEVGGTRAHLSLFALDALSGGSSLELPFPALDGLAPSSLVVHVRQGLDDPILQIRCDARGGGRPPKLYRRNAILRAVMLRPTAIPDAFCYGFRRGAFHRIGTHARTFTGDEPRVLAPPLLDTTIELPADSRMGILLYTANPQTDELHIVGLCVRRGAE